MLAPVLCWSFFVYIYLLCVCVSCSYIEQVFVSICLLQCVEDLDDPKASVLLANQIRQGFWRQTGR